MDKFDSVANIDVERMVIATLFMGVVALVILIKRRMTKSMHKTDEEK